MLLEVLLNGLCLLNFEVDCLCMVCEMIISVNGKLEEFQFYEVVMNLYVCLIYIKVWNILQGDKEFYQCYEFYVFYLCNFYDLYCVFKKVCVKCGVIEFEI